jgi:hypothetical protein
MDWVLAVDVPASTRQAIAMWGAAFGFDHSWTDAPSEPWHHRWAAEEVDWAMVNKWRGPKGRVRAAVHRVKHGGPVVLPKHKSRYFADIYEGDTTFEREGLQAGWQ